MGVETTTTCDVCERVLEEGEGYRQSTRKRVPMTSGVYSVMIEGGIEPPDPLHCLSCWDMLMQMASIARQAKEEAPQ